MAPRLHGLAAKHGDVLRQQAQDRSDRVRALQIAARDGSKFVVDRDFEAHVGATSHLRAPRSVEQWRAGFGKTVRFKAGDEVDADTVQRLLAAGRELPVRVVPTAPPVPAERPPWPDDWDPDFNRKAFAHLHWKAGASGE